MNTLQANIVTPNGKVFDGDVHMVSVRATSGEMGILPNHMPIVAPLEVSAVRLKNYGETEWVAVSGGFVEVGPEGVNILAEEAVRSENIDVKSVQQSKADAEGKLSGLQKGTAAYNTALRDVKYAEQRLDIASK